jgi:hypothetical protein
MAYGIRYTAQWKAKGKFGTLFISQKDYSGTFETLKLQNDAIVITQQLENWESHIIGATCEFNIVNNKANYYDLLDLMIATERKYKVVVSCSVETESEPEVYTLFAGFINTEAVTQRFLRYSIIHLVASSFVSKLEFVYPTSLDIVGNVSLIDIFHEILAQAGSTYSIRVYSYLISSNSTYSATKTFMNQNGLYNEIFWENNVDRVDSKKILGDILTTFQCYLYFWNGYWYIDSFDLLFEVTRNYVQYDYGVSYTPASNGMLQIVSLPVNDVHDLIMIETMQNLTVIPGNRTVEVRVNNQAFYNLTSSDFKNVVKTTSPFYPNLKEWRAYEPLSTEMDWVDEGLPYKTMTNSIKRISTYVNKGKDNAEAYPYTWKGLSTKFKITNVENTQLSISWKYSSGLPWYTPESGDISFRWELLVFDIVTNYLLGGIVYDGEKYYLKSDESKNETAIPCTEIDPQTYIVNFSLNIPLNEVSGLSDGNYVMVLKINTETFRNIKKPSVDHIQNTAYYGDVLIQASINKNEADVIEGKTNTDFIEKKTIELQLADVPNFNYKNGVLEGNNFERLTEQWYRNELAKRTLADYVLIDKFRMGDVVRQRITGKAKSTSLLRPLSLFVESKQNNKKFILTGIVHDVTKDEYEFTLDEYDNETTINLIET